MAPGSVTSQCVRWTFAEAGAISVGETAQLPEAEVRGDASDLCRAWIGRQQRAPNVIEAPCAGELRGSLAKKL